MEKENVKIDWWVIWGENSKSYFFRPIVRPNISDYWPIVAMDETVTAGPFDTKNQAENWPSKDLDK